MTAGPAGKVFPRNVRWLNDIVTLRSCADAEPADTITATNASGRNLVISDRTLNPRARQSRQNYKTNSVGVEFQKRWRLRLVVRPFGSVISAVSAPLKVIVTGATLLLLRVFCRH